MGDCASYIDLAQLAGAEKPLFFFLEFTPACNNRCPGCSNVFAQERAPAPLSADGWKGIINKLAFHVGWLKLTGGEPTLHPQFQEIVSHVSRLDIPFTLLTNGRWPEPGQLIAFLQGISQLGGLLVSLHGPDAPSHEAFTGVPGSFAETVANIRQATRAGLVVSTSTVVTRHNANRVDEVVALAADLGADHAVFNRYIGPPLLEIEASPVQERRALRRVKELIADRSGPLTVRLGTPLPHCFLSTEGSGCLAGEAFATVDPWGNVRPCNHAPFAIGSLLEQTTEEIWRSEVMGRWRGMRPAPCQICLELPCCHGGCRAEAMLRGLEQDPLMCGPIRGKAPDLQQEPPLYEYGRPRGRFVIRPVPLGLILLARGSNVIPVVPQAKPILDALDGTLTLRQMEERFGQESLNFVRTLYKKGLIELCQ